ncbi:MAG: PD-(D/E)XK nuclease family protein [Spirochaetaceae bacterium]|nr:PD-(D/E)XK nuclease family protein [Spirochaetaceae bacterium]
MSEFELTIPEIQNLLLQVKAIKQKSDAVLDATGGRFNIFKILDVNQYETIHSKIIASFLNPKGTHGMKSRFLELFIQECELESFCFNCENATVITEASAPTEWTNGRIDILIKSNSKMIIIENKLLAKDQPQQLKRYDEWAKKNSFQYKILYLTKDEHEASNQSGDGVEYKTISYPREITNWLEKCCLESAKYPLVRETIVQYKNLIEHYTGGSMTQQATNEIVELLAKDENIQIAQLISENFLKAKKIIATEIFNEIETIMRETFPNKYKKEIKGKIGDENFSIRYEIESLTDMYVYFLFGETKTEKINLNILKCNLSYKKGKDEISKEEKQKYEKKYMTLLTDIKNPVGLIPSTYSPWRMGYRNWHIEKEDFLNEIKNLMKTLNESK